MTHNTHMISEASQRVHEFIQQIARSFELMNTLRAVHKLNHECLCMIYVCKCAMFVTYFKIIKYALRELFMNINDTLVNSSDLFVNLRKVL